MIGAIASSITATSLSSQRAQREYQEKENKRKKICNFLLLQERSEFMEINESDIIKVVSITHTDFYNNHYNQDEKWVAHKDEPIIKDTFSDCLSELISQEKAKGIQILPYHVDDNYVDAYRIIMKV